MSFVRLRKVDSKYYASLVENHREGKKVRQKVLQNYGRVRRSFIRRVFDLKPTQREIDRTVG